MKKCSKCKNYKDINEFSKSKQTKDGFRCYCKLCRRFESKLYSEKYPEKRKTTSKKYYKTHKKQCNNATLRWQKNNIKKFEETSMTWRSLNKNKIKNNEKKWRLNNPGKVNAKTRKYQANKLNATPKWLTDAQLIEIEEFYICASELSWLSDGGLHVDHINPLQGKNSCGLHVPWNLQILPAKLNRMKSNKV